MLVVLLLILALVCFAAAALGFGGRLNLLAVGLALWVAAELVRVWP